MLTLQSAEDFRMLWAHGALQAEGRETNGQRSLRGQRPDALQGGQRLLQGRKVRLGELTRPELPHLQIRNDMVPAAEN